MSFSLWLRHLRAVFAPRASSGRSRHHAPAQAGDAEDFTDIREISRVLSNAPEKAFSAKYPDNVEFFLILGNVFRVRGDIDRAVRLRESLLARPALAREQKAGIFFELGCDYHKAGLYDRALAAYKESRKYGYPEAALSRELALLAADSGDFETAAAEAAKSGDIRAQACYMVRQAEEDAAAQRDAVAMNLVKRALRVFPGSPEAWLRLGCISLMAGDVRKAALRFQSGIDRTDAPGKLILLEGLHAFVHGPAAPNIHIKDVAALAGEISEHIHNRENDALLCYYAGMLSRAGENDKDAEAWFTKALVLDPEFWAARLAILGLAAGRETLPLLLSQQIEFFVQRAARARRFYCLSCGMRRDMIFSFCPRCRSWHSAAFRSRIA